MSFLLTTMLRRCCALILILLCVLTVPDAAAQTITLSLSPTSLTEDAGSADIAVTATLSATRSSATTITLSLAGTATEGAGKDYTAQDPLPTITIPANTATGNTTLVVSPRDDTFYEGDETIEVNGSAGSLTVTGASLTLTDNDEAPSVRLLFLDFFILSESVVTTPVTVALEARLEGGTTLEEDLDITIVLTGSTKDSDYTVNPDPLPTITINAGETTGRLTFTIAIIDDALSERETIHFGGRVDAPDPMLTIISAGGKEILDNDRVEFLLRSIKRTDEQGNGAWMYKDNPTNIIVKALSQPFTVALGAPATFTLTSNSFFTISPDPLVITIGADQVPPEASATVRVTYIAPDKETLSMDVVRQVSDATLNYDGPFQFRFPPHERPRINVLAGDNNYNLTSVELSDNERYIEGDRIFFRIHYTGSFISTRDPTLEFYLDDELRQATCILTCFYQVRSGDFANTIRVPVQGNIYPADAVFTHARSEQSVTLNSAITTEHTFSAQVRGGLNYIELLTDLESLQEGVGATRVEVQATILQGRLSGTDIEIPLVLTDDTTTPADYTVSGTQAITIPANQSSGSTTLLITPVDDYVKENRTETVQIAGGMSEYWVEGTNLKIIDAPSIMLSVSPSTITEDGGAQQVTVTAGLGDPSDQVRPRPIPVTLRLFGRAGSGDYSVAEQLIVTIPVNARSATKTLTFTPVNDRLLEGDETIVLRGSTPGLTVESTELTLIDDDMVPEVRLIIDDNTISESDGAATQVMVTAELDPSVITNNNTIVTLHLMGSAVQGSGGDYTAAWSPSNKQITVPALSDAGTAPVRLTLRPQQDDVAEGDETIEVEGMAVVGNTGVERIVRVATITLKDDDLPDVVIDPTALAVPEGGSNTYTVKLTTEPTGNVTIGMITVLSATDISTDRTALTFTPNNWNQAQTMTVRAVEDNDAIVDDPVTLTHTVSGGGYGDVEVDDVVVTITENDTPVLSIAPASLEEADANMTFTVTLNVFSDKEITVDYATSDGTATAGEDYTAVTATTLTFTAGTREQTISVPIIEDELDEDDETFTVTLSNVSNATLSGGGQTLSATGTIINDDRKPVVTLTPASQSVLEDAGSMAFTVTLDAESSKEITVDYATSDGTATEPDDYGQKTGTLTFSPGESLTEVVTVSIEDDELDEDNETFTMTLSTPVNAVFAGDASAINATGTITDDDDTPSLSIADARIEEASANMAFTVTLSAASAKTVTVDYATSDGTATEPDDYEEQASTLTFDPGETTKEIQVQILEDDIDEAEEETFTVTLSNPGNATIADATATGTIEDDDDPRVEVSFDAENYTVNEGETVTVTVRLDKDPERTVVIPLRRTHQDGATTADYSGVSSSLTFNAGETEIEIAFTAIDDNIDDDDEKVVLGFGTLPDRVSTGTGTATTATVAINDDDDPQVTVSYDKTSYSVAEGATQTVRVRLDKDPERTVEIPIDKTHQNGATEDDYSGVPENVTFNAGEMEKTFTFTATDDDIDDNNEKVVLGFGTLTDNRVTRGSSATITITDDDERGVTVEPTTLNVPEGESRTYTVVLKSEPTADVTVTVTVPSGRTGDVSVSGSPLTFTSSNWREAQTVTVSAVDDNAVTPDADVTLTHGVSGGDYAGESASSVRVTIINDDSPTLTIDDVRASEDTEMMIFTVELSQAIAEAVTVTYQTLNGTATAPSDYTAVTATPLEFASNQTSETISVSIENDALDEEDETFRVRLSNASNATIADAEAIGTIEDDDPEPVLTLSPASLSASEGAGSMAFTVTLGAASAKTVTVNFQTSDGTAESGKDYTETSRPLTFSPGGNLTQTISVPITHDALDEEDETFKVALSGASNATITGDEAIGTIEDDDPEPVLTLTPANQTVSEGAGSMAFTVTLGAQSAKTVTVNYATVNGTATAPSDYTATSGMLTFSPGDPLTRTFTVPIRDDDEDEDEEENFTLTLSAAVNATFSGGGTTLSATGTIRDDDVPLVRLEFIPGFQSVNEGEMVTVTVGLRGNADPERTLSIPLTVMGTPFAPDAGPNDYSGVPSSVTLNSSNRSSSFTFTAIDDNIDEGDGTRDYEQLRIGSGMLPDRVELTSAESRRTGAIRILDNDEAKLSIADESVRESARNMTFMVTMSVPSSREVTVRYETGDATATVGKDYTAANGTLTFSPGDTEKTFTVPILQDALDEEDETFTVSLSNVTNAAIEDNEATGTIEDDDEPPMLRIADASIEEHDEDMVFTVTLGAPSEKTIMVSYATSNNTAESGKDYTETSGMLTFSPGDPLMQEIRVPILEDALDEEDEEDFTVTLSGESNATISDASATGTIEDDDDPPALSIGDESESEDVGTMTFTVTLSAPSAKTVRVNYATSNNTATAPSDYTARNGMLTFSPGDTEKTFTVSIIDDALDEEDEEEFTIRLSLSSNANATLRDAVATGTIEDNDDPPVLSIAEESLMENGGTMRFRVRLNVASSRQVTVRYATLDGTATVDEDYTSAIGLLTFSPGTTEQTMSVPILQDAIDEEDETFTVRLSFPTSATLFGGGATLSTTGTIRDDDDPPVLSIRDASLEEEDAGMVFIVSLSAESAKTITVDYATMAGTATAGVDYTERNGTLTFEPGDLLTQTIAVPIIEDAIDEEDEETFKVTLSMASNATLMDDEATGTIRDDDDPPVLSIGTDQTLTEADADMVFTVSLSAASSKEITVNYATSNVTAESGKDYTARSGTLMFEPGESLIQTISVPIFDDNIDEEEETFTLGLSNVQNATLDDANATGTITDDEVTPTVTLTLTPTSIGENGEISTVTATLSGASSEAVTVTVSASAVSPAVSGDFNLSGNKRLTIAAGATTSTGQVTIRAVNNNVDAPNKTITVSGSASGGLDVADPTSQTLTIEDDEDTPTVTLTLSPTSIGENGGTSRVTARLSGRSSEDVTVTVFTTAEFPAVSNDFTQSGTTLTITSGATTSTGTVTITAVNNDTDAPDKEITVSGSASGGLGVAHPADKTLTIRDDEALPTVMLTLTPTSIGENGGISTVTASMNRPSSEAVTVTVSAVSVSPAMASDFTLSGTTLTIAAGSTTSTGTVTITAVNNGTDAPDKKITVSGSASGGRGVSAPDAVTLTITDDEDLPEVTLALSQTSIAENGGVSAVTAMLNRPSSEAVTVTVSAAAVSPAVSGDFTLSGNRRLTITAGQTMSTGTVTITAVNNDTDAPNKEITVSASASGGLGVAAPDAQTLTIVDDEDTPTVMLVLTPQEIGENGEVSTVTATLSGKSSQAVTVTVSAAAVPPAVAEDFTQSGTTLTITAGSTTSTRRVTIRAVDNNVDAPNKEITVSATVSGGGGAVAPTSQILTITDDEGAPTVTLVLNPSSINENGGVSTVTATLTGPSSDDVTVTVISASMDITLSTNKTLTITAGQTTSTGTVTITAVNNETDAPDKEITVSGSASADVTSPTSQTLTIVDDEDTPTVTLVLNPSSINENGGVSTVTATLTGPSSDDVTVTVISASMDITLSTNKTLTITAGQTTSTGTVTITAVNNGTDAPDKEITVSGSASGGRGVSAPDAVTLTITDDEDLPEVTLALSQTSIAENGGVSAITAMLNRPSSEAVTVTVSAAAVPPAVSGDFTLSGNRRLTIAAGQTMSMGTVTITAENNTVDAPNKEITVSATVRGGGGVIAPEDQTLMIIDDEGAPTVMLVLTPDEIGENGGTSRVTATLSGASSDPVTVTVSANAVFPAVSSDFTQSGTTLTITAGQTTSTGTVTIRAVNNNTDAPNKEISVSATVSGGGGAVAPTSQTLTITDDETTPTVTLTLSPTSIGENGGISTVTASMNRPSSEGVTVTVSAASGDITQSGTTLMITAGQTTSTGTVTITAVNNNVDAPNKTVTVSGSANGGLGVMDPTSQTLTITDDDTRGVTISTNDLTVTEGNSADYTVKLDTEPTGDVIIAVNVPSGSEVSVDDATLRFTTSNYNNPQTVTVTAEADEDAVADAPVTLSHTVSGNDYQGVSAANVRVTIIEANTPTLTIADVRAAENVGNMAFEVTLSVASSNAVTVDYATANGTAMAGDDYRARNGTLTFSPGGTRTRTISVPIINDTIDEDEEETFTVSLSNASNAMIGDASATGTIEDNDVPQVEVSFARDTYTVNEGSAVMMVVSLNKDPEREVIIPILTSHQGGATTADYSRIPPSVTFNAGEREKTFEITATDDGIDDDNETITLRFGNLPTRVTAGSPSTVEIAITDGDIPEVTVSFARASYTASEGGNAVTVQVRLSADPERTVIIPLTATGRNGAETNDYDLPSTNLTFNPTETVQTFTLTATDDDIDDDNETVELGFGTLPDKVSAALVRPTTVISLADNDTRGARVFPTTVNVPEGDSNTYVVELTSQPTAPVTVTVAGASGDISVSGSPLTFPPDDWREAQTVTVSAAEDNDALSDDPVTLTHAVSGGDYGAVTADAVEVRITENDAPVLTINDERGVENIGRMMFEVTLSQISSDVVRVDYATQGGSATQGTDYTQTSGTLTFSSGDTEKQIAVTIRDDAIDENDETFTVTLSNAQNAELANNEATGTIIDNDEPTPTPPTPTPPTPTPPTPTPPTPTPPPVLPEVIVSFGEASYEATEGGSAAMVRVSLSADPEREVTIPLTATPENGATDADYSGVPERITFSNGETSKTFEVVALDDDIDDDDESITLSFGTLPDNVEAGSPATATVSLTDNDVSVTVSFDQARYTAAEGGTAATIMVRLSADPKREVTIPLTVTSANGATSADYSGVPERITFSNGETSKTFEVVALDDDIDDDDESITLSFGTLPDNVEAGSPATVVLADNDDPVVTVSFDQTRYKTTEGGNTATIRVSLSADPERTVAILLIVTPKNGATEDDYAGVPQSIIFTSGETEKTFEIVAVDDEIDDDDESITLSFGTLSHRVNPGSLATVALADNDDPVVTVSFGQAHYRAAEGGRAATVRVSLSADPERTVIIPLSATPANRATEADYSGVPESITFTNGETEKTFEITATDDEIDDDDESITLSFGTLPDNVESGSPATIALIDNDDPVVNVSFGQVTYEATEGGSTAMVIVSLSADPERTVAIPLIATPANGATQDDYSGVPESITFTNGETEKTFEITATDDDIDDDDESITLSFGTLPDNVEAGSPATVALADNDDPVVNVSFGQVTYEATEGGSTAMVIVSLSADPERTVAIPLIATPANGATQDDYSGVPQSITFNSGETNKTFEITATDDDIDDDDESITLSFGTLSDRVEAGSPATVALIDNDDPIVAVSFDRATYETTEGGSTAMVIVSLSADPERTVAIPLIATPANGATQDDYSGVPQSITFNSGETNKTFEITATDDDIDDDDESITLSFGTLSDRVEAGSPATVALIDNDDPIVEVSFEQSTYETTEGGSTALVTLTLSADPERTVVIPLIAMPENGATQDDYSGVPQSITFNSGETNKTFEITATDDEIDDDGREHDAHLRHPAAQSSHRASLNSDGESNRQRRSHSRGLL